MAEKSYYETIGRLFSRQRIRKLVNMLSMAGIDIPPESFVGFLLILSILVAVVAFLISAQVEILTAYAAGIAVLAFACTWLFAYVMILMRVDARRRSVETVLPDFLQLAAANVRAGMPIDQAMWYAAKPEFGLLSEEVEIVAKRTFGGEQFQKTLDRLASRFNSRILTQAVSLVKQGLSSGGQMAEILERTASDTRNMQTIKKEISTSLLMYVIFILFAACFGAPFLYAVSYKLVSFLSYIWAKIPPISAEASKHALVAPSAPSIQPAQFLLFAVGATVITAASASMIVAVIQTGYKRNGVKYMPVIVLLSLIIFFGVNFVLDALFKTVLV
ncbi:MAG: type II secretion system F family protein [Candidatus Micrarchaeota archaeon]